MSVALGGASESSLAHSFWTPPGLALTQVRGCMGWGRVDVCAGRSGRAEEGGRLAGGVQLRFQHASQCGLVRPWAGGAGRCKAAR